MIVKGNVTVLNGGHTSPAKVGDRVNEGDKITAAKDSLAKLVMVDKNVLNLTAESEVVIENYKSGAAGSVASVTLNVLYGKLRSTLNRKYDGQKEKFNIKTQVAVAGVRGTDFLTTYSATQKEARIVTFEGQVQVGASLDANGEIKNPVVVGPGQRTIAGVKGVAAPTAVPKEELVALNRETSAQDTPLLEVTAGVCLDKILTAVGQQTLMKTVNGSKVGHYKIINVQIDSWAPQKNYTVMSLGSSDGAVKFEKVFKFTAQPDANCVFRLVDLE